MNVSDAACLPRLNGRDTSATRPRHIGGRVGITRDRVRMRSNIIRVLFRPWYGLSEYTHFVGLSPTSSWWKSHFKSKKSTSTYVSTKFELTVLEEDWMDFRLEYAQMWQIWPKAYDWNSGWECERCRVLAESKNPRHVRDTSATHARLDSANWRQSENKV